MAKKYAKKFYNSKAWLGCRMSYISKVHGLCEHCMENDTYTQGHIVDHIEEITPENIDNPNITLNHDNLQYLCLPCHNKKTFGNREETVRDGLAFNSEGRLIEGRHS